MKEGACEKMERVERESDECVGEVCVGGDSLGSHSTLWSEILKILWGEVLSLFKSI